MRLQSSPPEFRAGHLALSQDQARQVLENIGIIEVLDLESVLWKTVEAMVELTGADFSRLFLFDETERMLHVRASFGRDVSSEPPVMSIRPNQGVAGKAFESGDAICLGDIQGHDEFINADWNKKEGMRSFMVHPIHYRGRKIGVMNCLSRQKNFFGEEDKSVLSILASHAAIAIHNAWLHEEVEQRVMRLNVLQTISRKLNENLEVADIFEAIADGSEKLIGATRCHVMMRKENSGRIEFLYSRGLSQEYLGSLREKFDLTLVATAESKLEPVFCEDVYSDSRFGLPMGLVASEGIGAVLVTPLVCESKSFGLLTLHWDKKRKFSPSEISLAKLFSDQAAIAIRNAEYHAEAVRSRKFFECVFQDNADAIIIVSHPEGLIIHWNTAAEKLYGYRPGEILGQNIKTIIPSDAYELNMDRRERVLNVGISEQFDTVRVSKRGTLIPVRVALTRIKDEVGKITAVVGVHRDISEQKQREEALRQASAEYKSQARTDKLTGLANRRVLEESLSREVNRNRRYGSPMSLLILDIDHFKRINDTHGHLVGDRVLSELAKVIRKLSRNTDIPARYGGEEFCIVLTETALDEALHFAERLRVEFAKQWHDGVNGGKFGVTCSIGIAEFQNDEDDEMSIMTRADAALYQAKQTGRNRICTA